MGAGRWGEAAVGDGEGRRPERCWPLTLDAMFYRVPAAWYTLDADIGRYFLQGSGRVGHIGR